MNEKCKYSVLLVDPVLRFKDYLKTVFEKTEFDLFFASTGKAALKAIFEHKPNVIIMEARLPDMDGPTLLSLLRGQKFTEPVLVVSGSHNSDLILQMSSFGIREFITKPVEPERILSLLRKTLSLEKTSPKASRKNPDAPLVLVVDDVGYSRTLLNRVLSKEGYEVVESPDGGSAMQKIRENPPDLLLLDLRLPVLSGEEVIRKLKKEKFEFPIISISAYGSVQKIAELKQLGITDYFAKPLDLDQMRGRIKEIFSAKEGLLSSDGEKKIEDEFLI